MNLPLGRRTVLSLATAALVAASGLGLAQEGKGKAKASESERLRVGRACVRRHHQGGAGHQGGDPRLDDHR